MSLFRHVTAGLVVVASLTACSPEQPLPVPTAAEIGGTWVNGETRLTLMQDKTFTLETLLAIWIPWVTETGNLDLPVPTPQQGHGI
ncbi:hypothetical protein ABIE35_002945 [Paenarthrobacter sp. 4246]